MFCVSEMSLLNLSRLIHLKSGSIPFTNFFFFLVEGKFSYFHQWWQCGRSQLYSVMILGDFKVSRLFSFFAGAWKYKLYKVKHVCLCFSRLQQSHHYPTSTWRSASKRQQGQKQRHLQRANQDGLDCRHAWSNRRRKEAEEMFWLWEGMRKGFNSLLTSVTLLGPSLPIPNYPPHLRMPAEQCPALFLKISTQMTGMSIFSFTSKWMHTRLPWQKL